MGAPLTPVDEVLDYLISKADCVVEKEWVELQHARDRVLATDVVSAINVPLMDNSAMDGYAINTNDISVGDELVVSDRIPAGKTGQDLVSGTVARIFTGAPVPRGANAVVMQELTEKVGDKVRISEMPGEGVNIRRAGQDIDQGTTILQVGRRLRAQDLGLIASVGCDRVQVFRRLKIAVMSTGDELIEPPVPLQPGQIYNSNHPTLIAMIHQLGMEPVDIGLVEDSAEATEKALKDAAGKADCIVSTGGVSVGEEDYVKSTVERLGRLELWRIAMKPGKPLAFGYIDETPFFGLPGNPVSSFVTFLIVARPFFLKLQGCYELRLPSMTAPAEFAMKPGLRREYCRVRVEYDGSGKEVVTNFDNQGSGVLSSVSWANGLAEIEMGREINPGDLIKVYLLPDA